MEHVGLTPSGKRLDTTNWKDPPFLLGILTKSMGIVNSYVELHEDTMVDACSTLIKLDLIYMHDIYNDGYNGGIYFTMSK